MAAPATIIRCTYTFRDAKGQVGQMRVYQGGADANAINTSISANMVIHLQALSNGHVTCRNFADTQDHTYGTTADYKDVEDKLQLTFADENGGLHRFRLPAPKLTSAGGAVFLADGETPDVANAQVAALLTDMQANAYANAQATVPMVFIGGYRYRARTIRRFNVFTKNPQLTGPGL
jgi:hypothetical protein